MNTPLLRLENINLSLENFALQDINIDLHSQEVHVVMGENGSGKSLLMQIICGLVSPMSGTMHVDGQEVKTTQLSSGRGHDMIYIRQDATMLTQLSIAENLFFHNLPYKSKLLRNIDYDKLNYMCQQMIDELDLPVSVLDRVSDLGFAQRQIMEFCRAYVSDASIVILDEPSASLTMSERDLLFRIVHRIRKRGAGVFYITHCLDDVFSFGDRVTVMRKGHIMGTRTVAGSTKADIIHMLSGQYIKERYPKIHTSRGKKMLSVRNLTFANKLHDINFDLHAGEILGVTGLAGSGRTLLANCLFGAADGMSAQIEVVGKEVSLKSPYQAIEHGIALIPEDRLADSIFATLNIRDNMSVSSLKRFTNFATINATILEQVVATYIDKLNINHNPNHKMLEYSGGNQQKSIFAKWIMSRSKIFILDEPTRGLDIASKIDIYNSINDLVKKNTGIIFISSDIEEILGVCDRVAVLANQTIVCDRPTKEITAEEVISLATGK